jgi:hypothetical protein
MALRQQFQQSALRNVCFALHLPWPERCHPFRARDLGDGEFSGAASFDCKYLDAFTAIRIIGWSQAGAFTGPTFTGE